MLKSYSGWWQPVAFWCQPQQAPWVFELIGGSVVWGLRVWGQGLTMKVKYLMNFQFRTPFCLSWFQPLCSMVDIPPPVNNLNLRLCPPVTEELFVRPGRQEDGVQPKKDHEHDHSDVLRTRHRLPDPPHVQWWPHRHRARHGCHVDFLLAINKPHGQLRNWHVILIILKVSKEE